MPAAGRAVGRASHLLRISAREFCSVPTAINLGLPSGCFSATKDTEKLGSALRGIIEPRCAPLRHSSPAELSTPLMALATLGPSNWKQLGGDEHLALSLRDRMADALREVEQKGPETAWIVGRLLVADQCLGQPEGTPSRTCTPRKSCALRCIV